MVTTRRSARNTQQNGNTLPEEGEEEARPLPTHTTSLTPEELRFIHQLCRFQSKRPVSPFDHELQRHLYRFTCFMPPPDSLRTPSAWGAADWRDPPDAPLPTAVARAHVLLSWPGALAPIPASPAPPAPTALLQSQSLLFSVIPPEIRTRIFELAVAYNGKARVQRRCCARHAAEHANIAIPAIAAVSRLVRRETLPLFFKVNDFTFAPLTDSIGQTMSKDAMGQWLNAMRPHLPSMHQLTFEEKCRDKVAGPDSKDILSVTIRHDSQRNRWTITSGDDWSSKDEADRQSLERDNALLEQILVPMLDERSRDDLTPPYLMWLMQDLRMFYAGEKLEPKYPPDYHWIIGARGSGPDVVRPPDMYTRHLDHEYSSQQPH